MRAAWAAFGIGFAVCTALALWTEIPVGVTAADLQAETEAVQTAKPEYAVEEAVQKAAEQLETKQRNRVFYLFSAYLILWTLLGAYLYMLSVKQKRIQAELDRLSALLDADNPPDPDDADE